MSANVVDLAKYRAFKDELAKIAESGGLQKTALVGALLRGAAKLAPKLMSGARKAGKLLPKGKAIGARGGFTRAKSLPSAKPVGARGGPAPRRAPPPAAVSRGQVQPPAMKPGLLSQQRAARAGKPMPSAAPMGQRQSAGRVLPKGRAVGQRDVASTVSAQRTLPTPASKFPKATPMGQRQSGKRFLPTRAAPVAAPSQAPSQQPAPPTRLRPARPNPLQIAA